MTDLINTTFINGEKTTFFNYVNNLEVGLPVGGTGYDYGAFLTAQFGDDRNVWTRGTTDTSQWSIRWPVPWETLTGSVGTNAGSVNPGTNARGNFAPNNTNLTYCSSNTSTWSLSFCRNININPGIGSAMVYCVINNYCQIHAFSSSTANRNTMAWKYSGWLKDRQYTGGASPRGFVMMGLGSASTNIGRRPTTENTSNILSVLTTQNPTLSCQIATPEANSTDVIVRDNDTGNYLGRLWNMIILPASSVVGKIYKNTGIDPDTGVVETDQKAFWVCVGSFGTNKIGMRVWTENIT